jgi:hypothetical protein
MNTTRRTDTDAWLQARHLGDFLVDHGVADMVADMVADFRREALTAADAVREHVRNVQWSLDDVTRSLDGGNHVNSLGALQGQGSRLDIACALYEKAWENKSRVEYPYRDLVEQFDAILTEEG